MAPGCPLCQFAATEDQAHIDFNGDAVLFAAPVS
jgi:hypothetical protein